MKISTRCASLFVCFITLGAVLSTLSPVAEAQHRVRSAAGAAGSRPVSQVQALLGQAASARLHGQVEKALSLYEEAMKLATALKDRQWKAAALNGLGSVYSGTGEPQKALDYFHQALLLLRAVGDKAGEATTLSNISALSKPVKKP